MEVSFKVSGWPPAKSETLSMFGANHGHNVRVRLLLEAARDALAASEWRMSTERVGLELIVQRTTDQEPWDATNYLGGVADVLQDKSRAVGRLDLSHLGDLQGVAMFANDRQIKEVHYREVEGSAQEYQVRVWILAGRTGTYPAAST